MIRTYSVRYVASAEVVPVRAVPFVTGGDISPLGIAQLLADPEQGIRAQFVDKATGAGGTMLSKNWKGVTRALAAANRQGGDISYGNVELLPASTYVYLEDLQRVYEVNYLPPREDLTAYSPEERGNFQLQLHAYIPKALVELVFEGGATQGASSAPAAVLTAPIRQPPVTVAPSSAQPLPGGLLSWSVKKPIRRDPLTDALITLLTTMKTDGNTCPKARDIMDSFRVKKPAEIDGILNDELKYVASNGNIKPVSLEALQKRLNKLLHRPPAIVS